MKDSIMYLSCFDDCSGIVCNGELDNLTGFSWAYSYYYPNAMNRRLYVQAFMGGEITDPMPAVMDDFGTIRITS